MIIFPATQPQRIRRIGMLGVVSERFEARGYWNPHAIVFHTQIQFGEEQLDRQTGGTNGRGENGHTHTFFGTSQSSQYERIVTNNREQQQAQMMG